jgi:hypothetical protein
MPKNEPDESDPLELELVGVRDDTGTATRVMAECFADEFLRLGYTPGDVMDLFRQPEHALPHRAWNELGEVAVFAMVQELAEQRARIRAAYARARGARHA